MGSTERAEHYQQDLNDLILEMNDLAIKHNALVNSMSSLWRVMGLTSEDLQTELACESQIEILKGMIYAGSLTKEQDLIPQNYFLPNSSTGDRQQSFDFGSIAF